MRRINRLACIAALVGSMSLYAQQTAVYTGPYATFNHAVALYNEQEYLAAQLLFDKIKKENSSENKEIEADCAYYIANCAIRLDQSGAENKIDDFVANYPTSSKQNIAYIEATDYYFTRGQFAKAAHYAAKVKDNVIETEKVADRFFFEKGYSSFYMKNRKEAKKYLEKVSQKGEWGEQATYYLGYIAYDTDNFDDAKKLFEKVESKEKYKEKMGYFQADMNFKTGNFEQAITDGLSQIDKSNPQEKSELAKIIGESYFNLKQYDKALPYLLEYKGKNGKWNNTDYYQLGYAYYKSKDYEKAIEQFNKIIDGDNAIAQNAYYHLGESYLHTHKKTQALNAFKNASEMRFDASIQEDAYLNYGKLSYDIGNAYQSAPKVISGFMEKYPSSPYKEEMEGLLIDSYISAKNFSEALTLLEKNKTTANKEAYQKVTFYRGLELFAEGKYDDALAMFTKSLVERQDGVFTARAYYWQAESNYALNKFSEAISSYVSFLGSPQAKNTNEYKNVNYGLGYTYFKQKDYSNAAKQFQSFIATAPKDEARRVDAYLRLGDSQFVEGSYWAAMESYNKVIEANKVDVEYARFQKAIAYGFVDRLQKKADDLIAFTKDYPKSSLADNALYELGMTYVVMQQPQKATPIFDQLLKNFPKSSYASKALLRQGLIHYNANRPDEALIKFKEVVAKYPTSAEAIEAVQNARLVYVDQGKVDEYGVWAKGLSFVSVSDLELDKDTYESAEKQYMQNNTQAAIAGFEKYLATYPKGLKALQAHFYLGQMYFAANNSKKAQTHYLAVVEGNKNEYVEVSLSRLAELYLKDKDTDQALLMLSRLENEAAQEQNKVFAKSNLMKLYYQEEDYTNALDYAEQVLKMAKIDDKVKSDAQIIIARTAFANKQYDKAKKGYADVAKIAKGELAAEALYYDAFFKRMDNKFDASNESVQKLAKDYSTNKYYGAKGLVLMAKNFYSLKDAYQATYILDSVIKNFGEFSDVVAEAQQELNTIKSQEAKRNSSVVQ